MKLAWVDIVSSLEYGCSVKCLVLFAGGGLATRGIEWAGLETVSVEIDARYSKLHSLHCKGEVFTGDVIALAPHLVDRADCVWMSPPCQVRSLARKGPTRARCYLEWCIDFAEKYCRSKPYWIENVSNGDDGWGKLYNFAQFTKVPLQNRVRVIGTNVRRGPMVLRPFQRWIDGASMTVKSYEWLCETNSSGLSGWLGHRATIEDCAYYQGFRVPGTWKETVKRDPHTVYRVIGNGVPPLMAKRFMEVIA